MGVPRVPVSTFGISGYPWPPIALMGTSGTYGCPFWVSLWVFLAFCTVIFWAPLLVSHQSHHGHHGCGHPGGRLPPHHHHRVHHIVFAAQAYYQHHLTTTISFLT